MKTALLIFLLIPVATFIGFVFADVIANLKRSNNTSQTDKWTARKDYQQNEQNYYNKTQKHGKVVQMKYRAVK